MFFVVPWRVLFDAAFAGRISGVGAQLALPETTSAAAATPPKAVEQPAPALAPTRSLVHVTAPESALQLLAALQREGRLLDFVNDEIDGASDADIGAAARAVHAGCRKAVREYFAVEPISGDAEGARAELPAGFDATRFRLIGNVTGTPPYVGVVQHRGYRVSKVEMPQVVDGHDLHVLQPAEIDVQA